MRFEKQNKTRCCVPAHQYRDFIKETKTKSHSERYCLMTPHHNEYFYCRRHYQQSKEDKPQSGRSHLQLTRSVFRITKELCKSIRKQKTEWTIVDIQNWTQTGNSQRKKHQQPIIIKVPSLTIHYGNKNGTMTYYFIPNAEAKVGKPSNLTHWQGHGNRSLFLSAGGTPGKAEDVPLVPWLFL